MSLKGRKVFGFIFISIFIMIIAIGMMIYNPENFPEVAPWIICGLLAGYALFAFSNLVSSFIKSAWFNEKLQGK